MDCACGCGLEVPHGGRYVNGACRQRAFRRRERHRIRELPVTDLQAVTKARPVTPAEAVTVVDGVTQDLAVTEDLAVTPGGAVTRARAVTAAATVTALHRDVTAGEPVTGLEPVTLGARTLPGHLPGLARFAYADPPYPGCAHLYRSEPYTCEVNHAILIGTLCRHYPDGWALSTGSRQLQSVLELCPPGVRVGIWHRPGRSRVLARPRTWEAVIVCGGRERPELEVADHLEAGAPSVPGFHGAKPLRFSLWVFALLGARPSDHLADLFSGSGAVTKAWRRFQAGPDFGADGPGPGSYPTRATAGRCPAPRRSTPAMACHREPRHPAGACRAR